MPIFGQLIFPENSTYADFEVSLVDDNIPELEVVYQVGIYTLMYVYSHLPKVFVQTQISTHISSHLSAYHRKYTPNEVLIT